MLPPYVLRIVLAAVFLSNVHHFQVRWRPQPLVQRSRLHSLHAFILRRITLVRWTRMVVVVLAVALNMKPFLQDPSWRGRRLFGPKVAPNLLLRGRQLGGRV